MSESWLLIIIVAALGLAVLWGVIKAVFVKVVPPPSVQEQLAAMFKSGGFFFERNQQMRPVMERDGLTYAGDVARPPVRVTMLYGRMMEQVYQGTIDGLTMTIGTFMEGVDTDDREERMVAVMSSPDLQAPAKADLLGTLGGTKREWAVETAAGYAAVKRSWPTRGIGGYLTVEQMTDFEQKMVALARSISLSLPRGSDRPRDSRS